MLYIKTLLFLQNYISRTVPIFREVSHHPIL